MELLEACCKSAPLWENISACFQNAILVIDMEGRIVLASPSAERVLGFTVDELIGQELSIVFTPEDLRYLYPNLLYLTHNFEAFDDEVMLMKKGGRRFMALMTLRTYSDPDEKQIATVVSVQDIDRQKQLENFLEESHYEDLIKVADGIAHEIRNPLVGIGGFVTRLYKMCRQVQGHHKSYYDHIIDNLNKIESLVHKIEFFARLPKPQFSRENISELVQEALKLHTRRIEEHQIDVVMDVRELELCLDKDLIIWVFSILIENAVEALSERGKILLYSEMEESNQCVVYVADTGRGISDKDIPHVFNPFFSTKAQGTGMDLAIAKRIMMSHGGSIELESNEGEGTTFFLRLPVERRRSIRASLFQDAIHSDISENPVDD
jgi:PAS domain S-box-containing protein